MKKLFLGMIILGALASCSKEITEDTEGGKCYFGCLISDKYTADSVFVVRDSLWVDECLTKYWWEKNKEAAALNDGLFRHCNPFVRNGKVISLEIWTYVFDKNKQTPIKIFR